MFFKQMIKKSAARLPKPPLAQNPYDAFADVYDSLWSKGIERGFYRTLKKLLPPPPHISDAAQVLDLCCGSGKIAKLLAAQGFKVTGVDASQAMLERARRRAPHATFICSRIEDLRFTKSSKLNAEALLNAEAFDAAICIFDSLNHLLDVRTLEAALRKVSRALKPGGLFIFDVNTEAAFHLRWQEHFNLIGAREVVVVQGVYDSDARLGHYDFTVFQKSAATEKLNSSKHKSSNNDSPNPWRRTDFTVTERCHTPKEITRSLTRAGFLQFETFDAERELALRGHTGRIFYLAHKPSAD